MGALTTFAELPKGGPDGFAFDVTGRLWVAAPDADAIIVFEPGGKSAVIETGRAFPTNVAFAGPERDILVTTAAKGGRILARPTDTTGLALHAR